MVKRPMIREIRKKMVILQNRWPINPDVKAYLADLEGREWVYMNLRLSGSPLAKENIDTIMDGGCILEGSIDDHLLIARLQQLRQYIYRLTDMGVGLSMNILKDMHRIVTGGGEAEFRKGHPILLEYGYNPMMPAEIPRAMAQVVSFAAEEPALAQDAFTHSAMIHNRLVEIYPYKEGSQLLARAAAYYFLVEQGYPMASLDLSEQAYNDSIIAYLKSGSCQTMEQALMEAVLSRLNLMVRLTERA